MQENLKNGIDVAVAGKVGKTYLFTAHLLYRFTDPLTSYFQLKDIKSFTKKMGKRKRNANSANHFELESKFIYAANVLSTRDNSAIDALNAQLQEVFDSKYNHELGVFLNLYFDLVKERNNEVHQDIQTLIDVADINEILINTIGKQLETLVTSA